MCEIGSPLRRAFAHNDYLHDRPLYDALAHGFTTVEADVFLEGDELRVGHNRRDLEPGRTLSSLYLDPLADLVRAHGAIWPDRPLQLLVDVKSEAAPTFLALAKVLAEHTSMLASRDERGHHEGAVGVTVSGHVDLSLMAAQPVWHATVDGRPHDLSAPSLVTTSISAKFGRHFEWDGRGRMPAAERSGLQDLVERIHASGRTARFWGTNEGMWPELLAAGVDQIIADDLSALREFLLAEEA